MCCAKCGRKKLRQARSVSAKSSRGSMRGGGEEGWECREERVWVETFTDGERVWGRWEREEVVYGEMGGRRGVSSEGERRGRQGRGGVKWKL